MNDLIAQGEKELATRQQRMDLDRLYQQHAAPFVKQYRQQQKAIREKVTQLDRVMFRLAKLNAKILDGILGRAIDEYRACSRHDGEIESGLEWLSSIDVEAELGARPQSRDQWEVACAKLDSRLGERCYKGDSVGAMQRAHDQAVARYDDLAARAKRQGVSLFGKTSGDFVPPVSEDEEIKGVEVITNLPPRD